MDRHNPLQSAPHPLDSNLIESLVKIAKLVQEKKSPPDECAKVLALMRVLTGVELTDWERFASSNALENWIGIPLDCPPTNALSQTLSLHICPVCGQERDALTGTGNYNLFKRLFTAECDRALRSCTDISLLMLEMSDFTRIHHTCDHTCGIQALRRFGTLLKTHLRHYDTPVHLDGEKFAVILPSTSCWTAIVLGNRLLDSFRREKFISNETEFSMNFSGGAASLALLESDTNCADQLIKNAQEALDKAKQQGENHITLIESHKLARDRSSLVLSQEKQFLFSCLGSE
ncbi:MAG: GGDEF domain-containing protein [Desulfovibrio sp.]|jgi:diguanylate cyclase (GGDEF)-like protein|nr:GGDEF domain-containing protein [Desulfovibrio sp.]